MFSLSNEEKEIYLHKIEIDITEECNLSCVSCVRGCDKFKSNKYMTPDQVQSFVDMSWNYPWKLIGIMGGELTTHPQLPEILEIMHKYKVHNPSCEIWCMTNGIIDYKFPSWLTVHRNKDHSHHHAFYVSAPDVNYPMNKSKCHVLTDCGMGYSINGFTPCCNTSSIIRAFNLVDGIQDLANVTYENLMKLCDIYCRHCGWYMMDSFTEGYLLTYPVDYMSKSWVKAYEKYNRLK